MKTTLAGSCFKERDSRFLEKTYLNNLVDNWDLNRITIEEDKIGVTLASGGQGKVKIANIHDMTVTVKILHNFSTRDYSNEVFHIYKYRHPNIPKFLGMFESPELYGLVQEFIDGISLSKYILLEKTGKITVKLSQKVFHMIQLASVIEFLHDHHLIHRDLKPDNIMIDTMGNIKLLDYGIAIPESKGKINLQSREFALTPSFMPPEILKAAAMKDEIVDDEEEEEQLQEASEQEEQEEPVSDNDENDDIILTKDSLVENKKIPESTKPTNNEITEFVSLKRTARSLSSLNTASQSNAITITGGKNHTFRSSFGLFSKYNKNKDKVSGADTVVVNTQNYLDDNLFVNITNKVDVWTFGLILSEVMTLTKPWGFNQKDQPNEYQINSYIMQDQEFIIPKTWCYQTFKNQIIDIIKNATKFEPVQRSTMHELKEQLILVFNQLVSEEIRLTEQNQGESFIEGQVNSKISLKQKKNTDTLEYSNRLTKDIDKMNIRDLQKISLTKQRIAEYEEKIGSVLKNKKQVSTTSKININRGETENEELPHNSFKTFNYMIFDEVNDQVMRVEFPTHEITLDKEILKHQTQTQFWNPFCLYHKSKLFIICTQGMNTKISKFKETCQTYSLLNNTRVNEDDSEFQSKIFNVNNCFVYSGGKSHNLLNLNFYRTKISGIIFNNYLWIIGGNNHNGKKCEGLYVEQDENSLVKQQWKYFPDLIQD